MLVHFFSSFSLLLFLFFLFLRLLVPLSSFCLRCFNFPVGISGLSLLCSVFLHATREHKQKGSGGNKRRAVVAFGRREQSSEIGFSELPPQ